jgi:nucleotide-binding universal stress UspA family protein
MKILLAIDGSTYSEAAVREVISRPWPLHTAVRVISVAHAIPLIPLMYGLAFHMESLKNEQERAIRDVGKAADDIAKGAPALQVSTQVLEGSPKKLIVEEAEHWQADLVVVASHGHGPTERFLLGSTAHEVAVHSPCPVEIVRSPRRVGA